MQATVSGMPRGTSMNCNDPFPMSNDQWLRLSPLGIGHWSLVIAVVMTLLFASGLAAKEELVTLPTRDSVQLTIYNSEDLTLVRERRTLSFKQGDNRLQFSWANTLIDPTSVEFMPVGASATVLELKDTSFPAESHEMLIWTVACTQPGPHAV